MLIHLGNYKVLEGGTIKGNLIPINLKMYTIIQKTLICTSVPMEINFERKSGPRSISGNATMQITVTNNFTTRMIGMKKYPSDITMSRL